MFSIRGLRLYFPCWSPGLRGLLFFSSVPPGLSGVNVGLHGLLAVTLPTLFIPQSASLWVQPHCHESRQPQLPISAPSSGLEECFFFISLVVGLLCGSIFCHFWLFFVFKLLLSFFWLCEEAQCVYLCLHLGWKLIVYF